MSEVTDSAHPFALLLGVEPPPGDPQHLSAKHDTLVPLEFNPRAIGLACEVLVLLKNDAQR
eukprot:5512574-Alexandrium_andersonii.AAC.1